MQVASSTVTGKNTSIKILSLFRSQKRAVEDLRTTDNPFLMTCPSTFCEISCNFNTCPIPESPKLEFWSSF